MDLKVNSTCKNHYISLGSDQSKCAYVILIMGVFWVFEFVPLAVTSLIPVALYPLMGLMATSDVASLYFNSTVMLMLGST